MFHLNKLFSFLYFPFFSFTFRQWLVAVHEAPWFVAIFCPTLPWLESPHSPVIGSSNLPWLSSTRPLKAPGTQHPEGSNAWRLRYQMTGPESLFTEDNWSTQCDGRWAYRRLTLCSHVLELTGWWPPGIQAAHFMLTSLVHTMWWPLGLQATHFMLTYAGALRVMAALLQAAQFVLTYADI